jgi:hypothetical protein
VLQAIVNQAGGQRQVDFRLGGAKRKTGDKPYFALQIRPRDSYAHILLVGMHRERENSHVMRIPRLLAGCAVAVKKSSEG